MAKYLQGKKLLAGDDLTYVDFYFFERLQLMIHVTNGKILNEMPILNEYNETMKNLPQLKEYLEDNNCPELWLKFNNKHAKINGNIGPNFFIN